jgi:hypothetical protein
VLTLPGVAGTVAHDAADADNPLKVGARARTSDITAVATNDRVDLVADSLGKQIVSNQTSPENMVTGTTAAMTGTADTSVIASPGAGRRLYITTLVVTNNHATTATDVVIKDGATARITVRAPAGATIVIPLPIPLRLTAATALQAANVTTASSTLVAAVGYSAGN